jgi:transcriptional regulator with XRE-family HTH domain
MTEFLEWRSALKLSQFQAADALGLSRRTVQYYESGEQPLPNKVRFAMEHLAEHRGKLKDARSAATPLNDIQRRTLASLADGETHKIDRKIGKALARRKLARELAGGFTITDAGRAETQ